LVGFGFESMYKSASFYPFFLLFLQFFMPNLIPKPYSILKMYPF
jgi:hypothetical protein